VMEFIEQPDFRQIVLGPLSCITVENGHTVLTKHLLCRDTFQLGPITLRHAHMSEETTRVGLYEFLRGGTFIFDSSPWVEGSPSHVLQGEHIKVSPIGIAIAGMLHLTIKQALDEDDTVIARAP